MRIKDWDKFQHFKDRKPIWIKFYRSVLDDKEWHELDPLSSKILVMLWLLASEDSGQLPTLEKIAFRLRIPEKSIQSSLFKLSHWLIQDDINVISSCHQDVILEKRREETEKKPQRAIVDIDWIDGIRTNAAYAHINVDAEMGKMDAWLTLPRNKHRKKTQSFVLNWLNKIDAPLSTGSGYPCQARINDGRFLKPCGKPATCGSDLSARCMQHGGTLE